MTRLYRNESSNSKWDAQRNLSHRSHYVDDDTLRFHKSRIVYTHVIADGLSYMLVESYAVYPDNRRRAFRGVVFDIFGDVIDRPKLDEGYRTSEKALSVTMEVIKNLDFKAITMEGIKRQEKNTKQELSYLRGILKDKAA